MPELTRRYIVMAMTNEAQFDANDPEAPFVLKPWKDPAALRALETYRDHCYPELAADLAAWIQTINAGARVRGGVGARNEAHSSTLSPPKQAASPIQPEPRQLPPAHSPPMQSPSTQLSNYNPVDRASRRSRRSIRASEKEEAAADARSALEIPTWLVIGALLSIGAFVTGGIVGGIFFFGLWAFVILVVWLLRNR